MLEGVFALCWTQHGGSGLSLSFTEACDLPLDDFYWLLQRMVEQRGKEAGELRKAASVP